MYVHRILQFIPQAILYIYMSIGVYVPVGGKKLLTFLDDLNMPAKDEYGSQPPLELVRQWIDYGFWYDRLKQTMKEIRVRTPSHFHCPGCMKYITPGYMYNTRDTCSIYCM